MGIKIKAQLAGADQLREILKDLRGSTQRKILRPALAKEGRIIAANAKSEVPVKTGLYRRAISRKSKTYGEAVVEIIGPRRGVEKMVNGKRKVAAWYAHLVEFGVRPHAVGKGSSLRKGVQVGKKHPGFPGRHPLTRSYKKSLAGAEARVAQAVKEGIERLAAKGKLK